MDFLVTISKPLFQNMFSKNTYFPNRKSLVNSEEKNLSISMNKTNKIPIAIENEFKQIEKFKEKQKVELQALIHHNLTAHIKKKENEEKSKHILQRSLEKALLNQINTRKIIILSFKLIKYFYISN